MGNHPESKIDSLELEVGVPGSLTWLSLGKYVAFPAPKEFVLECFSWICMFVGNDCYVTRL